MNKIALKVFSLIFLSFYNLILLADSNERKIEDVPVVHTYVVRLKIDEQNQKADPIPANNDLEKTIERLMQLAKETEKNISKKGNKIDATNMIRLISISNITRDGFTANLTPRAANRLSQDPSVKWVERTLTFTAE